MKGNSDNGMRRSMPKLAISVLVPTRNERDNIAPLVARLETVLPLGAAQVIFIDDSSDDTPDVIKAVASASRLPVEVIHRTSGERSGGLGGAVVTGMRAAVGDVVVVMDGDLQHPPETIPDLVLPIEQGTADLVVASRYRDEGDGSGLANLARVGVSRSATTLTKLAFPRQLADVTDPMSGFFAVRTDAIDIDARPGQPTVGVQAGGREHGHLEVVTPGRQLPGAASDDLVGHRLGRRALLDCAG